MNTDLSDYWMHFVSEYGRNSVHIAPRFFDIAPDKWERLTSIYYSRHTFKKPPEDDAYIGPLPATGRQVIRSHRVDAICMENPPMDEMATFYYDSWMLKKAHLKKQREAEPQIRIEPPKPEPPPQPKPKPVELPPKEEPKKQEEPAKKQNPDPWIVKTGVWVGILGSVATVVSLFVPQAKPFVVAIVAVLKGIISALGG